MRKIFLLLGVCIILSGCAFSLGCSVRLFPSTPEKQTNCTNIYYGVNGKRVISCDDGTQININYEN